MIELHKGSIIAESEGRDLGSTFTVHLPTARATSATASERRAQSELPTASESLRVLVVDDNHDTVLLLSMMISMRGHEVAKAHNGIEALTAVQEFRPDVVFLDIGLPSLDGYEVARAIRETTSGARVHLVALTGWGSDEDKLRSYEAGFDQHLTKPVEGASIAAILEEAAARTRAISRRTT